MPVPMNPFESGSAGAKLWNLMKDQQYHSRTELQQLIGDAADLDGRLNVMNKKGRDAGGEWWVVKSKISAQLKFKATEVETIVQPTVVAPTPGIPTKKPEPPKVVTFDGKTLEINPNHFSTEVVDKMDQYIRSRVIGQDSAVDAVVDVYQRLVAGMHDTDKPLGNLLLLGPTGTGKTYLAEMLAEYLFPKQPPLGSNYPRRTMRKKQGSGPFAHEETVELPHPTGKEVIVKVDCGEYQEKHQLARLIGAPPGYLGYDEAGKSLFHPSNLNWIYSPVLKRHVNIILFDEIEKASDDLFRLMLGMLDKANVKMGDNTPATFNDSIIIMTSNIGAKQITEFLRKKKNIDLAEDSDAVRQLRDFAIEAAREKFAPEFFNRLDEVVAFVPLPEDAIQQIVVLELQKVDQRISKSRGGQVYIKYEKSTIDYLMKTGFHPEFGARALKRAIEQSIVKPISKLLSGGAVNAGDRIRIKADENGTKFFKVEDKVQ